MSVKATWSPEFTQIINWLTTASPIVRNEAMAVMRDETEAAARDLAARVRRKTGRLARSIRTEFPSETVILGKVRASAAHAHLQFGTKQRTNKRGANRGAMPDVDVLVDVARERRRRIEQRMRDVVLRNGFSLKG